MGKFKVGGLVKIEDAVGCVTAEIVHVRNEQINCIILSVKNKTSTRYSWANVYTVGEIVSWHIGIVELLFKKPKPDCILSFLKALNKLEKQL